MATYLLDALSCCRLVNAPKLFRTVLKLARTWWSTWKKRDASCSLYASIRHEYNNICMRAHLCKRCYNHIVTMTERQRERRFSVTHLQYVLTWHHGSVFTFSTPLRREREECRSSHQISFSVSDALHHSDMFTHDIGHQLRPYFTTRNTSGTREGFSERNEGNYGQSCFCTCWVLQRMKKFSQQPHYKLWAVCDLAVQYHHNDPHPSFLRVLFLFFNRTWACLHHIPLR